MGGMSSSNLKLGGAFLLVGAALLFSVPMVPADDAVPRDNSVYVISNGFHTGIIIDRYMEGADAIIISKNFAPYRYMDIGWGDEEFYQADDPGLYLGARAILVPTSSVISVEGFSANIENVASFSGRMVSIRVDEKSFGKLCAFINASLTKDGGGHPVPVSKGYGGHVFFKSPRKYHLFNTCNTWVAEAFQYAGYDISPVAVITADTLFRRLEKIGKAMK